MSRYPHVVCRDGASVSIQAGYGLYATAHPAGGYTTVEAGFPSVPPPDSWLPYAEDADDLLQTVYPFLPWDCVDAFIAAHGGMVQGILPPRAEEED